MNKIKKITITKARNNFFELLRKGYLEKQIYLVEKGGIPISYIVPTTIGGVEDLVNRERLRS